MTTKKNMFETMLAVNVNNHTEKKGQFTYLSWPFAVAELRKSDPTATWEVIKYDGKPYCASDCGFFVEVAVTVDGVTLSQIHPVLDNRNQPIKQPNSFHINTSIQRCLVKAIALHGLGLYIYAGEDLPEAEKEDYKAKQEDYKAILANIYRAEDEDTINAIVTSREFNELPQAGQDKLIQLAEQAKRNLQQEAI